MVCLIDIDGVLNYYPDCWVAYVNTKLDKSYKSLKEVKDNVPYNLYRKLKEEYRYCGVKENLPIKNGAQELLEKIREKGKIIVIMTARPIYKNQRMFELTINWLNKKNLVYDDLFFTDKKDIAALKYFSDIDFVVEDNRRNANEIASTGVKVYLVNNKYNEGPVESLVKRVDSLYEIIEEIS